MTLEKEQKLNVLKKINPERINTLIKIAISVTVPILIYASILKVDLDLPKEIVSADRYGSLWLLGGFYILLFIAYSLPGNLGRISSFSLTLVLFALPLVRLWSTGISEWMTLGGLLPWSDANSYYWHAGRILQGLPMAPSAYNARPISVGILSVLLGLTQQNLQITIAILTGLVAISCFFVAREIQKIYGTASSILVLLCLYIFARPSIGTLMTENLGLCLGVLSFALLLRGTRTMSLNLTLVGLFILTIGLNVRTGTLFVLPALLLWGCYTFRGSKRFSQQFLLGGFSVILLGFLVNSLLLKAIGHPDSGSTYANFAFTFYGVITQTDWQQMVKDYPEIKLLSPEQVEEKANSILWQTIQENPLALITGMINEWKKFFFGNYFSLFFWYRGRLEIALRALGCVGLFACLFKLTKPTSSLMIVYLLGVVASIPFVGGTFMLRIYAVTIIIFPVLSAIGLAIILEKVVQPILSFSWNLVKQGSFISSVHLTSLFSATNIPKDSVTAQQNWKDQVLPVFSIALVVLSFIAPITIKQISSIPQTDHLFCPPSLEKQYFRNNPGSSINLVSDDAIIDTRLPDIRISDYRKGLTNFAQWLKEEPKALAKLSSGFTILDTYNYEWLVVKSSLIPRERGLILACGTREKVGYLNLFHADYIKSVSP